MDIMLTGIIAVAVLADLATYKIPNALVYIGLVASLLIILISGGPPDLIHSLINVILTFVPLFILYLVHCIGAGDAKLLLIPASILGVRHTIIILICSLFMSGIYGMIKKLILLIKNNNEKGLCRLHFSPFILLGSLLHMAGYI